jgi:ribose transport system permease protein
MSNTTTSAAPSVGGGGLSAKQVRMRSIIQAVGMLPVLFILAIAFNYLGEGRFLSGQNLSIVAQQAAINIVLGAGMTFVILTGGIDLSVGSILAASVMSALIASLIPDWGWLGVPAALLTGLVFGLLNGSLIAFGKLPPFIVTLGSLTAVRGVARLMGADTTVFNPELSFAAIGNATIPVAPGFGIPVLAVIAFVVILLSWYVLRRTVLGVWIYAVGGNPAAARLSGIKVWRILLFVYAVSGLT